MSRKIETEVFAAGKPLVGQWVLMWRTPVMPAPAFWYFDAEVEARHAEEDMKIGRSHQGECVKASGSR